MKGSYITYDQTIGLLLQLIPEILPDYEIERAKWRVGTPPPHVVYGSTFAKFVERNIDKLRAAPDDSIEAVVVRCFAHVEDLASSDDVEVRNVVLTSVLESLLDDATKYGSISHYFGHETNRLALKVLADAEGKPDIRQIRDSC